jgi:hypothetical protein
LEFTESDSDSDESIENEEEPIMINDKEKNDNKEANSGGVDPSKVQIEIEQKKAQSLEIDILNVKVNKFERIKQLKSKLEDRNLCIKCSFGILQSPCFLTFTITLSTIVGFIVLLNVLIRLF